jgi:hypothetical protein
MERLVRRRKGVYNKTKVMGQQNAPGDDNHLKGEMFTNLVTSCKNAQHMSDT